MPWKTSFRYNQPVGDRTAGWSENFWSSLPDIAAVRAAAVALGNALWQLHGDGVNLPSVRISNALSFRDVSVIPLNLFSAIPATPTSSDADYPTNALLLKLTGQGSYLTRQWIKGIWDGVVTRGGIYTPTATYTTRVNSLINTLTNAANGWTLRVSDRSIPFKPVKDITQAGIVSVTGHGYADNSRVRISRVKGLTQANRIWRITRIDADTFSLQGWVAPDVTTPYLGNGLARQVAYVYPAIAAGQIERATKHNVGRPFGALTGRRRTRRS